MILSTRGKRWLLLLFLIVVGLASIHIFKDRLATKALRAVAQVAERSGHRISFGEVSVSFLGGHIHLSDLHVVPMVDSTVSNPAVRYSLHADAIDLRGVDLLALLRRKVLHVGHIELRAPSVVHSFMTHETSAVPPGNTPHQSTKATLGGLDVLHVDTLLITDATGRSQDRANTNAALAVADADLLLTGVDVRMDAQGRPQLTLLQARIDLHTAVAHLEPYYTLSLDSVRVRMPENTAAVFGLRVTPDVSPKEYHKHVKHQVELYQAAADTLLLTGFDLNARLRDGALHAHMLYAAGVNLNIHRDKTLPLAPVHPKALMADRVTNWKLPIDLDSAVVHRASVTYHERLKPGGDYGSIAFTHINGQLTGLSNKPRPAPPDLHLVGTARVGRASARLDLRMPMHRDRTTVTAHVVLTGFAATGMNRMTDQLLHVEATAGMLHHVEMHMHGDEHSSTGTLEMRYEDLHLELGREIKHAKVFTRLANTVVRTSNMPDRKDYRVGHFTVKRPVDAGVFKYIWISLREGMLEVVLPPALLKQMRKQQGGK
ncbi:MAG: hypothetical protein IT229_03235 [Flavobacteriales bacterium]|nr:hypothetical protein [Flavobacteriales bacterium]